MQHNVKQEHISFTKQRLHVQDTIYNTKTVYTFIYWLFVMYKV